MEDKLKMIGKVTIYNKTKGRVEFEKENIIVDDGLALLSERLAGNAVDGLSHLAIGIDATAETQFDTALGSEQYREAFLSYSTPGASVAFKTEIGGGQAIFTWKELGLFNAVAGGTMFNRVTVDFVHSSGDIIIVDWTITFAR